MEIHVIPIGIDNCYLIRGEKTILIDGGMPEQFHKFTRALKKLEIAAEEISLIVLTHAHWDHIGCLHKIKEYTGAEVAVQREEKEVVETGKWLMPPPVTGWGRVFAAFLRRYSQKFVLEATPVDIVIEESDFLLDDYGIKGRIVFTPGHSFGSISVVLDSGDAFVGDMAMNGPPLTWRPNLPIFAENISALMESWDKLKSLKVKRVYPAHGHAFDFDKIAHKLN